jgi:hypothetical protein
MPKQQLKFLYIQPFVSPFCGEQMAQSVGMEPLYPRTPANPFNQLPTSLPAEREHQWSTIREFTPPLKIFLYQA